MPKGPIKLIESTYFSITIKLILAILEALSRTEQKTLDHLHKQ